MWDRESPWSLPQPRVGVCVDSLTAQGSGTVVLTRSVTRVGVPVHPESPTHAHTHTNTCTLNNALLHVLCPGASRGVIIPPLSPWSSLQAVPLETWGISIVPSFIPSSSSSPSSSSLSFSSSSLTFGCASFSVMSVFSPSFFVF